MKYEALAVVLVLLALLVPGQPRAASPLVAPGFLLKDLDGNEVSLDGLLSEYDYLVVSFWQVG